MDFQMLSDDVFPFLLVKLVMCLYISKYLSNIYKMVGHIQRCVLNSGG